MFFFSLKKAMHMSPSPPPPPPKKKRMGRWEGGIFPCYSPGVEPENYIHRSLFICTYTVVLELNSLNIPSANVVKGLSKSVLKKNQ